MCIELTGSCLVLLFLSLLPSLQGWYLVSHFWHKWHAAVCWVERPLFWSRRRRKNDLVQCVLSRLQFKLMWKWFGGKKQGFYCVKHTLPCLHQQNFISNVFIFFTSCTRSQWKKNPEKHVLIYNLESFRVYTVYKNLEISTIKKKNCAK